MMRPSMQALIGGRQQTPQDIEAARENQMWASAQPVDLNAVATPQWQRFFKLVKGRGVDIGGKRSGFAQGGPSSFEMMQQAQRADELKARDMNAGRI